MNKIFGAGFLLIAFYNFFIQKDTATGIFYMTDTILFAVFDARDEIKELLKK